MNSYLEAESVSWREVFNKQYGWPLALICFGVSLHAFDFLMIATMLPAIVTDIGGEKLVSLTVTLYELGSIITSAACGLITVRYGIRVPMFVATLLFATGCVLSAIAAEMWIVLIGRLLQGLGGGGLLALSFVATAVLLPRRLLARAMGAVSLFWGASAFTGPLLGSFFVEFASWRGGFMFFALMAVLLLIGIQIKIKDTTEYTVDKEQTHFPVWRLMWLTAGIIAMGYAGVNISFTSTPVLFIAGLICFLMFLRLDNFRNSNRLLPHKPMSLYHPTGAAFIMTLTLSAASVALAIYGALIMIALHDVSVLTAGYVIAAQAVGWSVTGALTSGLPERHDTKMIGAGMLVAALGISGFVYSVPYGPIWLTAAFGLLEGIGFGMAWTFIPRRVCALVKPEEIKRATSAIPTAQAIGYALGASYVGFIANASGFSSQVEDINIRFSATAIFLSCIPLALLGLLATYKFVVTENPIDN